MLWFYRFLRGYLTVLFYGEFTEKILNLCVSNKISLWNSRLVKNGIETSLYVKDFRKLKKIVRKSGVRVHILKKRGLPFKVSKNRKRLGIAAGAVLFFVFLEVMSGFIWIIDVTGNKTVPTEDILAACRKIGIYEGIRSDKINSKSEREKLLLNIDSLAWASLNIEGCRLTVNVSEVQKKMEDNTIPCNLKAKADGIITKIDVTVGNCLVKAGDTVKKGDVLVSGILEKSDGTQFVHSIGTLTAVTERSITVSGEYEKTINEETGNHKKKRVFEIFTLKIPLFLGSETEEYNSYFSIKNLKLFGKNLPVRIYEREFRFFESRKTVLNREQLCLELENRIEEIIVEEKIENFTIEKREFTDTENGISLRVIVKAEENIVYSDPLYIKEEGSVSLN